jgi:hypothetical protein
METSVGWVTKEKRDGSQSLKEPFYTINPMYVAQHKEWFWQECDYRLAERECHRQLSGSYPQDGA